jgi:hypothetical protein
MKEGTMEYVCDAPPYTWFRIMTDAEAGQESKAMDHAVEKYFRQMRERAEASYVPPRSGLYVEQSIGRKDHIKRSMPIFVTLRDREGKALVTAMLPPGGREDGSFRPIIVGTGNGDPYVEYTDAIEALGRHYGLVLDPDRCFPYRR